MRFKNILFPSLIITTLAFPLSFAIACNSRKIETVQAHLFVKATLTDQNLDSNIIVDKKQYESIKENQMNFSSSLIDKSGETIFENDFFKFSFDQQAINCLKSIDNAKKLIQKAIYSMNVTSLTHLNKERKKIIQIKVVDDNADAGGYDFNKQTISIGLSERAFKSDFDAAMELYAQAINHEWGHFETIGLLTSKYGANKDIGNLNRRWNDFVNDLNSYDTSFSSKANSQKLSDTQPWELDENNIPFQNQSEWPFASNIDKNKWTAMLNQIYKQDFVKIGSQDPNVLLAELMTRIQLGYTYPVNISKLIDNNLGASEKPSTFMNQLEAIKTLNYDLFDAQKSDQAFFFMKDIAKNFYGVNDASGVKLDLDSQNKIQSLCFESLGHDYDREISRIAITSLGQNFVYSVNKEKIAYGFNKDIFNQQREYQYIIPSCYLYLDKNINIAFNSQSKIKLLDEKGNEIKTTIKISSWKS